MSKNLFEPFQSNLGLAFKNRICLAPMTNCQSHDDGTLSDDELRWLDLRARGGFGSMVTACAHVRKDAQGFPGEIGVFGDEHIPGLSRISAQWKINEAPSFLQLYHGGSRSPSRLTGVQPVAPSEIRLDFPGFEVPRALEDHEIEELIVDFKDAAVRAQKAGFTGIEVHGANGYLFTQFLSRQTNLRTDRWGGESKNRARFLLRVVKEIKKALPAPFVTGVRILGEDTPANKGFDIDDMAEVAKWLVEAGADYIHLSLGQSALAEPWKYPNDGKTIVSRIRGAVGEKTLLIACGGVSQASMGQDILSEGADLVALARTAIASPDWPQRASDPNYTFKPLPLTERELANLAVSPNFVEYLRGMKMVASPNL